ncbi:hypothetical protein LOAG_14344 [Loa loa]|uniref:Uncharacterized protein n=1 Tax=Loa loa TaxID=7209 RepID=A0A1I7VHR8_LOALO|nr:hypothetical protein LOAG_14344 [Loa loa]EFO14181.1 hypothetical protein LOAG_14344 [Loa loa]
MSIRSDSPTSSENYGNTVRMSSLRCPIRPCTQEMLENYMSRVMQLMSGTNRIYTVFENYEIIEVILSLLMPLRLDNNQLE